MWRYLGGKQSERLSQSSDRFSVTSQMPKITKNSSSSSVAHPGSFRDPAGFIYSRNDAIYRQINKTGAKDYDLFMSSGLYKVLIEKKLLVPHREVSISFSLHARTAHKIIQPDNIPFISYPYEWSFSQLKDAALLTLEVQKLALEKGMTLKDASAYNIQFIGRQPIFIDTLSFAAYEPGAPWQGYKQFCEHFLAPLALATVSTPNIIPALKTMIDGIPLELATKLLPAKTRLQWGLTTHLFLHKTAQKKHKNTETVRLKPRVVSMFALKGLISSLERTIKKSHMPKIKTEWGKYYTNTNYSSSAFKAKKQLVEKFINKAKPKMVWDMGGNTGEFSQIPASKGIYTVCFDIDPLAVEQNYLHKDKSSAEKLLPLVQDLTNPSPNLGWAHHERQSLKRRGPADLCMALALVHHLAIGNNLPLEMIAEYFSAICKHLIIEFIPKEDSKVKILLKSRPDIFPEFTKPGFEKAMRQYFSVVASEPIKGSKRTLYLLKAKNAKI